MHFSFRLEIIKEQVNVNSIYCDEDRVEQVRLSENLTVYTTVIKDKRKFDNFNFINRQ